ncbi:PH domain-containing protein [Arcanobacterium phocisimile]|uniref:PH domain-containing protein n=1 Tax=Arcanobacterium phocisimile TaxID=1302235 RepID=A0ABX7IIE1_9ACTO|nr:PH domain-containing protein [Arcanobacterium phocisimile]QRV01880.1 PH domain-containing protein [Arcanobacterium phocisimile]
MDVIIRGEGSRLWAYLLWFLAAIILTASTINGGIAELLFALPLCLLIGFIAWIGWWNPRLVVTADGIRVVNVFREHLIPWADFSEAQNRWGLYLLTRSHKTFAVWALPSRVGLLQNSWRDRKKAAPDDIDWKADTVCQYALPLTFTADSLNIRNHAIRSDAALRRRLAPHLAGWEETSTTHFIPVHIIGSLALFALTVAMFIWR